MLIYGVHKYGMGNWDQIREDKSLGLDTKIANQEELDDGIKVKVFLVPCTPRPPTHTTRRHQCYRDEWKHW
jgi:hypothetical protein